MIDLIQILLTIVISVLTILLTFIGVAVYQILKEFKKSIEKMNLILADAARMSSAVAQPVEDASEFIHGIRGGIKFLSSVGRFFKEKDKLESKKKPETNLSSKNKPNKRFFRKAGKLLKKPNS